MSRITTVAKPKPKPSKKDSLFHLPFGYKTYIRPKPWHPAGSSAQAPMSCSSGTGSFFSPATSLSSSIPYTYFYILQIRGPACMGIDLNLGIIVTFFRTIADLFYLGQMVPKFRTPSSRVFGRGELVKNPHQIAVRYLRSDFVIDLIAMLPIPQIIIWFIIPAVSGSTAHTNNTLSLIVLLQYIPRLFLIFPLNARIVKTSGALAKTAWAGAAYNLILYMLASHVLGALWYLLSMERQNYCWLLECQKENGTMHGVICNPTFLDCKSLGLPQRQSWLNSTHVGYISYAQNISTTTYIGETSFCILICIVGLVLFSHLIGNMLGFTEVSLLVTAISLLPRTYWQPVPTLIKMLVCDNYNKYDRMNHTLFSNKQSLQYHDAHNLIQKLVFLGVHLKFS